MPNGPRRPVPYVLPSGVVAWGRPHSVIPDLTPHECQGKQRKEMRMPRTSKGDAPVLVDEDVIEGRYVDLDGYTVAFETFKEDFDPAPLFQGLPDDRCQCPHWGSVIRGKLILRYADRDEAYEAGDAYYAAPGHRPLVFAGSEV